MSLDNLYKAAGTALIGAAIGWGANGLTLGGRVSAIEQALARIEQRLDRVTTAGQGGKP